jgi:hypothetical protein
MPEGARERRRRGRAAGLLLLLATLACRGEKAGGALHAEQKLLEREVQGLRELAELMRRGEPVIPANDVTVVLDESLLRDLLAAQLPFEAEVDRYRVRLTAADAMFRGSPLVRLRGTLALRDSPDLAGEVSLLGALEKIEVDRATETLKAALSLDHLQIEKAGGLESWLGGTALDELARTLRLQITSQLPPLSIPVKIAERIPLPAIDQGPVRIEAAELPMQASVSRVIAGQGRLWIGISLRPGELVKTNAPAQGASR